mgnify:CR=1 FL=1
MIIGGVMSISNLYVGLKTGWAVGVAITACILSYAIWTCFYALGLARTSMTILENNCMQSTASAAGSSTGSTLATAIGALITGFATLTADRIIDENLSDAAGYGLEPPKISLQAKTKDGKTYRLRLGEETADQTGLYASVDGDKRLYALPAFNKDAFNKTAADLRDKHGVSLAGEVYEEPLHKQPVFASYVSGPLPVSEDYCARHLCLPVFSGMEEVDALHVVQALKTVIG